MLTKVCVLAAAFALVVLQAGNAEAASTVNRAVGSCTTTPSVPASRHYTTIQAAVDASVASGVPALILVCPGTYREQVVIASSPDYAPIITLKGAMSTGAVIAPPAGGLVANFQSSIPLFSAIDPNTGLPAHSNSNGWVAALVVVRDTVGVTVTNIEIDGTGAACASVGGVPSATAGIVFANVGDETSFTNAGLARFTQVHDLPAFQDGVCGYSEGIISENSYMKINDNTLRNVYDAGILQFGGIGEMLRNNVTYAQITGIRSVSAVPYDLSLNVINQTVGSAISLEAGSNGGTIDSNVISPTAPVGVYLNDAHNNAIVRNNISGNFGGVFLDWQSSGNLIQHNTIKNCSFACIMDRGSHGGNVFDANSMSNSATYGIWLYAADPDDINGNFFAGIPITVCHSSYAGFSTGFCAEGN